MIELEGETLLVVVFRVVCEMGGLPVVMKARLATANRLKVWRSGDMLDVSLSLLVGFCSN